MLKMKKLLWQILAGILGILLAQKFVSGISLEVLPESNFFSYPLTKNWQVVVLIGASLGLINFFVKPILDKITLPLKLLTFGLFSLILNMAIIWFLDILFLELKIANLSSLFFTTLICWGVNFILKIIL